MRGGGVKPQLGSVTNGAMQSSLLTIHPTELASLLASWRISPPSINEFSDLYCRRPAELEKPPGPYVAG